MSATPSLKQNLYNALVEIGLSENEMDLYTTSLSIGPASVAKLAAHVGISRPNVYKLIVALEKHGLANFSERKKYSRHFSVEPPAVLLQKLREKKEEVTKITAKVTDLMPDLYTLYHQGENPTKIKILKTEGEYINAVTQVISEVKSEICFFGSFDDFIDTVTLDTFSKFTELRLSRGVKSRTLIFSGEHDTLLRLNENTEKRELRFLKDISVFNTSFQVSAHSVIIWQPISSLAIWIQDEAIVLMFRAIFESEWEKSK